MFSESDYQALQSHADFIQQVMKINSDLTISRLLVLLKVALEPNKTSAQFIEDTGITTAAISRHLGYWRKCGNVPTKVEGPAWIKVDMDPTDCRIKPLDLTFHGQLELKRMVGNPANCSSFAEHYQGTKIHAFVPKRRMTDRRSKSRRENRHQNNLS
ncbi:MarR family winged helix-turn-helix transcriptional regulator [Limnobacter sp. 130]|uniref:MarR family winged helix-turn-helix transcriptional regulator n=1 Tax=Limnobacter sp. 130 TaxID=2653147 RepID=UPI0013587EFE|nr:MarR family winged helix-turn-helix transcriptional regulator [Limnobacter sp. 130]